MWILELEELKSREWSASEWFWSWSCQRNMPIVNINLYYDGCRCLCLVTQNTPGWWQRCITTMLTLHFISLALILVSDWYKGHGCMAFILCYNIINFVITLILFLVVVDFLNRRLYPSCSWDNLYRNSSSAFTFSPSLQATSASFFVPASYQLVSMQLNGVSVVLLTKQCWCSSC